MWRAGFVICAVLSGACSDGGLRVIGDPVLPEDAGAPLDDAGEALADAGRMDSGPAMQPDAGPPDAGMRPDAGPPPSTIGGSRAVTPYIPASYDGDPTPLLIILHGYGGTGREFEGYVRAHSLSESEGFLLLYPDGQVVDGDGNRAWGASDSDYLLGLIDAMELYYNVSDVYLYGLSSGAHMSYRLGCEAPERLSGIITLAGWGWPSASSCSPSEPLAVLHVHGTNDALVNYADGRPGSYPPVEELVSRWVSRNGCTESAMETLSNIDVDLNVGGNETEVFEFNDGCTDGQSVALWKVNGGTHVPEASPTFNPAAWNWISRFHR